MLNLGLQIRLLETLHHKNIITYHHAWLETCQFSAFGPKVPALQLSRPSMVIHKERSDKRRQRVDAVGGRGEVRRPWNLVQRHT